MIKKNRQLKDGESITLIDSVVHYLRCCDCGLVHRLDVSHGKGQRHTVVTFTRDNRATSQVRRYKKKVVDCCNPKCGWSGNSADCVCFKHDPTYLMCPECHEVVEY
ncbi:MAG: hypothetical protein WC332_01500 [Clostridia bacterium]|jgi:hypothetical protein